MTFTSYGLTYVRLSEEHLEMMRAWRNSDFVAKNMVYQKHITEEMQKDWFYRINNDENWYFVVYDKEKAIGIAHIKDVDHDKKTGEVGLFLSSEELADTDYGARITLGKIEFAFNDLQLERLFETVLLTNTQTLNTLKFLGCSIFETNDVFVKSYLDKDIFMARTEKLRKATQRIYSNN